MIKTLKKKFVLTAMFSLTILLAILITAVSILSYSNMEKATNDALEKAITSQLGNHTPKEDIQKPVFGYNIGINIDWRKDSFIVYVTDERITVNTPQSNTTNLDTEELEEYVKEVLKKDTEKGKVGSYKYLKKNFGTKGTKIAFIDVSTQIHMLTDIIKTTCFASLALLTVMFAIVYLISSKAVKPIAENIEKQKQFITNAGHEIKTPLTIIAANVDAWEINPNEHKYVNNIKEQTTRLSSITNKLLMLAKSDENGTPPDKTDICLSEIIENSIDEFSHLLNGRSFSENISENIFISANTMQLKEIINILLDNAIKYSTENSTIDIKLETKQGLAQLSITNKTDELPDVAPEVLFERFYRFDKSRNSKTGGSGIGLSIAEEFTKANGGNIKAQFKDTNTIVFTLSFKAK